MGSKAVMIVKRRKIEERFGRDKRNVLKKPGLETHTKMSLPSIKDTSKIECSKKH